MILHVKRESGYLPREPGGIETGRVSMFKRVG